MWAPSSPRGPLVIREAEADSKLAAGVLRKARQETLLSGPGDKERVLVVLPTQLPALLSSSQMRVSELPLDLGGSSRGVHRSTGGLAG